MKTHGFCFCRALLLSSAFFASAAPAATMPAPMVTGHHEFFGTFRLDAALDPSNNLIVSTGDGDVQAFSPAGCVPRWNLKLPGKAASGIAVDGAGKVYLTGGVSIW